MQQETGNGHNAACNAHTMRDAHQNPHGVGGGECDGVTGDDRARQGSKRSAAFFSTGGCGSESR